MKLHVQASVPMRLLATAKAMPTDLSPQGEKGVELDNEGVCERVLGPHWREQMALRAARVEGGAPVAAAPAAVVQRRQWVAGGATALDLGVLAAQRALAAADMPAHALAAILCVTSTPPLISAAMAARIGVALGCDEGLCNASCFDVRAGGVGVMLAWFSAQGLIAQGSGPVLIVAAEAASLFLQPGDVGSALLYADGAAACILAGGRDDGDAPEAGFLGGMSGQRRMQGRPTTIAGILPPQGDLDAYRFQRPDRAHLACLGELWGAFPRELTRAFPQASAALRHLLPYPVSLAQMAMAHEAMGQPQAQLFHELPTQGCLGAASPLASLHGLLESGRARPGEVLALLSGAGNGLWAGLFWRLA